MKPLKIGNSLYLRIPVEMRKDQITIFTDFTVTAEENKLIYQNNGEKMKLQDLRILYNTDKGRVTKFKFVEFKKGEPDTWPRSLYDHYTSDFGNCLSTWDNVTLEDILLKFGFIIPMANEKLMDEFIEELLKVDEFKDYKYRMSVMDLL